MKNHPLSRFATAPPARGSRAYGLRLAVARVPGRISVSLSSLMCFPLPARKGARGRVRLLVAGADACDGLKARVHGMLRHHAPVDQRSHIRSGSAAK